MRKIFQSPYEQQPYYLETQLLYGKDKLYVQFMNETRVVPPQKSTKDQSQISYLKLIQQNLKQTQNIPENPIKQAQNTSVESNQLIYELLPKTGIFRKRPTSGKLQSAGLRTSQTIKYQNQKMPNGMIISYK